MDTTLQQVREILQIISDIVFILAPIVATCYYGFRKKFGQKIKELKKQDKEKANQEFLHFSHLKSIWSMRNLEDICNRYVDVSHADCISYLQLENGTMADSRLQNMFITCMAESDRYSKLPKRMNKIQRMPLQSIISFIEKVNQNEKIEMISENVTSESDVRAKELLFPSNISAWRIRTIRNKSGYITGYVIFEYLFDGTRGLTEFNDDEQFGSIIDQCQAAIESELLRYEHQIESKKAELKI